MKFLCFVLVLVVSHAAADLVPVAVSSSIDVGGGEAVVEAVSVANAVSNAAADNLTAWAWPNQSFSPNQGKNYVAGQGCASSRSPTGCGCFNGDLNVPVLTQSAVSTRLVSTGSCQCTYYLPVGFAQTAGFTIMVQNICS